MRIEKEKHRVCISCNDGSLVKGFVYINQGERVIDFFNDPKESFIAVTHTEFYNFQEIPSFKLLAQMREKKPMVIVQKEAIKLIEEF